MKVLSTNSDKLTYTVLCLQLCINMYLIPDYIVPYLHTLFVIGENQKTVSLSFSNIKTFILSIFKSYHSVLIETFSHLEAWLTATGIVKFTWVSLSPSSCQCDHILEGSSSCLFVLLLLLGYSCFTMLC